MTLACLVLVAASLDVSSVANPRATNSWVSDGADMISAEDEARLNALGDALRASVGLELAVVTVTTVDGPTRRFAVELFNHWGVGDPRFNNGLLFLVAKKERALESVTGTGMQEVLTDSWLKQMQDSTMIPLFKRGDPGGGLVAGVTAVQAFLRQGAAGEGAVDGGAGAGVEIAEPVAFSPVAMPAAPVSQPASSPPPPTSPDPSSSSDSSSSGGSMPWQLPVGGGLFVALTGGGLFLRRKYWRTCRTCKGANVVLDEVADDAYLDAGQRKEESIGSIDYDVFYCAACATGMIRSRGKWFSGYKRCPKCRYKTRKVVSTTVQAATYSSGGRVRTDEDCKHCSFTRTSYHSTPRLVESSSSSGSSSGGGYSGGSSSGGGYSGGSSSGGGYSGGSSSGGGASSSW